MSKNETSGESGIGDVTRREVEAWKDEKTLQHLLIEKGYSQSKTADILSCSQPTVNRHATQISFDESEEIACQEPECSRTFRSEPAMKSHYGNTHEGSIAGVSVVCEWCGVEYREKEARLSRTRFCSEECRHDWMASDHAPHGEDHPAWSRLESVCMHCGKTFHHKKSRPDRRYCSIKCYHQDTATETVVLLCENCGSEYVERESRVARSRYCSKGCMHESKKYHIWVELQCVVCGDEYKVKPSRSESVCCSGACRGEYVGEFLRGDSNPRYASVEVQCKGCGDTIVRQPHRLQSQGNQFCSQDCQAAYRSQTGVFSGQDNPMWRGGSSLYNAVKTLIRDEYWPDTASRIRSRDGGTCRICGKHSSRQSRNLTANHIPALMDGGCNADHLLITVCDECHHKAETYIRAIPEVELQLRDWTDEELPEGRERWTPDTKTKSGFRGQSTLLEFGVRGSIRIPADD